LRFITPLATPIANPALSIRGLRKSYGDVVAVDGLDLEVRPGECFGFLGPNGAGKTTTLEICEGLVGQDAGEVEMLGLQWRTHERELRELLGVQLQDTQLSPKLTVEETVGLFRSFFRNGMRVPDVIDAVGLTEKRVARVVTLSGGQKQRLAIACALVGDPKLLFLDEPTTGLDPQSRRQIWELVEQYRAEGRTIILTTHYMEEAERLCDRVAIVDFGRVIALGPPSVLIDSLGAHQFVEFTVGEDIQIDASTLTALEGVLGVRKENATFAMRVDAIHRTVPRLLAALQRQGIELTSLRTRSATLEDVFVALTGRQLQEVS
jgi:ABC-2 type transport system ATP-binding protein